MDDTAVVWKVEEITIPVPWGQVAGKWWGPRSVRPILTLHGWQDNAGSFDRLIPLLPTHLSYLAIDWPGHGHSSRYPDGMVYSVMEYVQLIQFIADTFKWDKVSLLTHSMGSIIGYFYSSLFPERCDMVIAIEILRPFHSYEYVKSDYRRNIVDGLKADERNQAKTEPKAYTYAELLDRLCTAGDFMRVTPDTAPYLLKRAIRPSELHPDKYFFTRDARLKTIIFLMSNYDTYARMRADITAPFCSIQASNAPPSKYRQMLDYSETDDDFRQYPPPSNFIIHKLVGDHHIHLIEPEKVSGIITDFIQEHRPAKSKL